MLVVSLFPTHISQKAKNWNGQIFRQILRRIRTRGTEHCDICNHNCLKIAEYWKDSDPNTLKLTLGVILTQN